jgi:hypothetical protein
MFLKDGYLLELWIQFNSILEKHIVQLIDRDVSTAISICFLKHVICFFLWYVRIDFFEEFIEILVRDFLLLLAETHWIHYLLQI